MTFALRQIARHLQSYTSKTVAAAATGAGTRAFASTAMMPTYIKRLTAFNIPPPHIQAILSAYTTLRATAVRNGKPYILSNEAREVINTDSPLSNGFTIISSSVFASRDDHDFYDKECPAHKELKKVTGKWRVGDVQTIVYESEVAVGGGSKL